MMILRAMLIVAVLSLPGVAAPAEDRPDLTISTKSIEASVAVDKPLKSYPGLAANLLAEGRREMPKWRSEADKQRKRTPEYFHEDRRYSHERNYVQRSVVGRYVSIVRTDYFDGLGAHPNMVTNTILWDTTAKKRVSIRPLFKETADNGPTLTRLAKTIRAALAAEKRKRDLPVPDPETDEGLATVEPKLLALGAVALAPSTEAGKSAGLIFYFSPYVVGGYVEGSYDAFVPWALLKDDVSPEGAALFGGGRPKGDDENFH